MSICFNKIPCFQVFQWFMMSQWPTRGSPSNFKKIAGPNLNPQKIWSIAYTFAFPVHSNCFDYGLKRPLSNYENASNENYLKYQMGNEIYILFLFFNVLIWVYLLRHHTLIFSMVWSIFKSRFIEKILALEYHRKQKCSHG